MILQGRSNGRLNGRNQFRRYSRVIFVGFDDGITLQIELLLIRQHLVLAAGTCAKVLALYSRHVSPLGIWVENLEKVGMRVKTGMAVNTDANAFGREGEGSNDDPLATVVFCNGEGFACGRGDTRDGQVEMGGEVEWRLAVKVLFGEGEDVVVSKERDDLPGEDVVGGEGLWGATRVLF